MSTFIAMLSAVMLIVIILNIIRVSVDMLNVVEPRLGALSNGISKNNIA
jgi:hypothetical protein